MEEYIVVLLFLLTFGVIWTLLHLSRCLNDLDTKIKVQADLILNSKSEFDLDEMKESVLDLVEQTIGSMSPPTAADHFLGMISQYFQAKMMKDMNIPIPGLNALQENVDSEGL